MIPTPIYRERWLHVTQCALIIKGGGGADMKILPCKIYMYQVGMRIGPTFAGSIGRGENLDGIKSLREKPNGLPYILCCDG